MIQWKSVTPDIAPRDIGALISTLSLPDALAVTRAILIRPLILFANEANEIIVNHVSQRREESGGLLLGFAATPCSSTYSIQHPVVCITGVVPSQEYEGTSVSLHMDPSVWTSAIPKQQTGLMVVGWFHSHPNLGAFFSGTDRKTQHDFFSHPYSVGYVIDPVRDDHAFFIGADSTELDSAYVVRGSDKAALAAFLQC